MRGITLVAFIAVIAIWGTTWSVIKIGLEYMSPILFAAVRCLIAAAVTGFLYLAQRPKLPTRRGWIWGPIVFGLINAPAFALIFWGELIIPSGQAAILNSTVPVFTLIIARIFLGDEITSAKLLGIGLGIAGVLMIFGHSLTFGGSEREVLGNLALVTAAFLYGVSTVWGKRNLGDVPPLVSTGIQMASAGTALLVASPFVERPFWQAGSTASWLALLYLAVIGFVVAYLCFFYLLQHLPALQVAYVSVSIPVVAVAVGALTLHEPVRLQTLVGMVVILSGVIVLNRANAAAPARTGTRPLEG